MVSSWRELVSCAETAVSHIPSKGCQCAALGDAVFPAAIRRVYRVVIIVGYFSTIPPFRACEMVHI